LQLIAILPFCCLHDFGRDLALTTDKHHQKSRLSHCSRATSRIPWRFWVTLGDPIHYVLQDFHPIRNTHSLAIVVSISHTIIAVGGEPLLEITCSFEDCETITGATLSPIFVTFERFLHSPSPFFPLWSDSAISRNTHLRIRSYLDDCRNSGVTIDTLSLIHSRSKSIPQSRPFCWRTVFPQSALASASPQTPLPHLSSLPIIFHHRHHQSSSRHVTTYRNHQSLWFPSPCA
jgi:hypothetical protein